MSECLDALAACSKLRGAHTRRKRGVAVSSPLIWRDMSSVPLAGMAGREETTACLPGCCCCCWSGKKECDLEARLDFQKEGIEMIPDLFAPLPRCHSTDRRADVVCAGLSLGVDQRSLLLGIHSAKDAKKRVSSCCAAHAGPARISQQQPRRRCVPAHHRCMGVCMYAVVMYIQRCRTESW